jgi:tetratricopeptide (TPR) repeat protein
LLEQSIVLDPFNVRYLNSLGAVYLLNFGTTRALRIFEHAAAVDPDYAPTYLNLALCRLRSDFFGARRALARYLQMEPDNPVGRRLEAFLALAAGQDREALAALNKALKAAPNWAALYFDAARVAARAGNDRGAIRYLLEVLPHSSPGTALAVFDEATFSDTRQSPAGRAFREQMIMLLSEEALSDRGEAP